MVSAALLRSRRSGFSASELAIVLVIIALLLALISSSLFDSFCAAREGRLYAAIRDCQGLLVNPQNLNEAELRRCLGSAQAVKAVNDINAQLDIYIASLSDDARIAELNRLRLAVPPAKPPPDDGQPPEPDEEE
jgi:prepilin-type N-terminal cleavage/methylation domain-containing protein